jgi:hypothetical protein
MASKRASMACSRWCSLESTTQRSPFIFFRRVTLRTGARAQVADEPCTFCNPLMVPSVVQAVEPCIPDAERPIGRPRRQLGLSVLALPAGPSRPVCRLHLGPRDLCRVLDCPGSSVFRGTGCVLAWIGTGFRACFSVVELLATRSPWSRATLSLCMDGPHRSHGTGSGLHTFLLFLGPHIIRVANTASLCKSVDFTAEIHTYLSWRPEYTHDAWTCLRFGRFCVTALE